MGTTLALLFDMYAHVGPGLLLAFAMPLLVGLLGIIAVQAFRRIRARTEEVSEAA